MAKRGLYSNYSKEEVIELILSVKDKIDSTPQRRDFTCAQYDVMIRLFGTFANAIKASGLKPSKVMDTTPEELISSLLSYYEKTGHVPTTATIDPHLYNSQTYLKGLNCKGWSEVLEKAGLPIYIQTRKHLPTDPEEVITYAKKLIKEENIKSMNILLRHKKFHGIDRINSLFGNKYHFGELVGLEVKEYDIPFEKIRDHILEVINELGRTPTLLEMSDRGLSEQYLRRKFGSYNMLLHQVGAIPYATKPPTCELSTIELIDIYKEVSIKNGFENGCGARLLKQLSGIGADVFIARFGSINNLRTLCGYKRERPNRAMWNYENIESLFIAKTKQYKTRITQSIVSSDEDFPGITTIRRYLKCSFIEFTNRIFRLVNKASQ